MKATFCMLVCFLMIATVHDGLMAQRHDGAKVYAGFPNECRCATGHFGSVRTRYFSRPQPPGNLAQRLPYDAFRMYYYDRPYNPHHIQQRVNQPISQYAPMQLPYSRQIFNSVYRQLEPQIIHEQSLRYSDTSTGESVLEQIARDRNLEYADWLLHRENRIVWEQKQPQNSNAMSTEESLKAVPISSPVPMGESETNPTSLDYSDSGLNSR